MITVGLHNTVVTPTGPLNIRVDCTEYGCHVIMCDDDNPRSMHCTWDQIGDADWMYETFKYEYLIVFKAICDMVSKLADNKETYMELI